MANQVPNSKTIIDDYTNTNYTYICWTYDLSALSSQAKWIIKRITNATNVVMYADGNDQPDNIADNRATTVVYS